MKVEYVDHMGDDLMVVNAARVSFDKESELEKVYKTLEANVLPENEIQSFEVAIGERLKDGDTKLIRYLAKHQHWTPFAHPQICLRMKAPIFVRTQCFKHKQGFVENEISRRYVDDTPEFFVPDVWRGKPTDGAKQGSSTEVIDKMLCQTENGYSMCDPNILYKQMLDNCLHMYNELLEEGVAPEQARMVLPQSMYTSWYWTGSLAAYARFYKQRIDPHAQKEIQDLAKMVGEIIEPLYPVSWKELTS